MTESDRLTRAADETAPVVSLLGSCGTQSQGMRTRVNIDDVDIVDLRGGGRVYQRNFQSSVQFIQERRCYTPVLSPDPSELPWLIVTVFAE
jgi:hypothetical protein